MEEYKKRTKCAICNNNELEVLLDYGNVPLAGFFPKGEQLDNIKKYNLGLLYCDECHLMQTNSTIDADVLFKDYRYLSSIGLQKHFNEYSEFLIKRFSLNSSDKVVEFGSNDGVLLKPMMDAGINIVGFEPSNNISKIAIDRGCNILNDYFSIDTVHKYCEESSVSLVTSSNCFAHIDDIHSVVEGISYILKDDGYYSFEVHYGKNIIEESQYDNVYHEHIYYYTVTALKHLFEMYNMTIEDVIELPIHAGSIRVIVKNTKEGYNNKVTTILNNEVSLGMTSSSYYEDFKGNVMKHKKEIYNTLLKLKSEGKKIGAYGASGRANILCNFCGLDETIIDYIIDESPERYNRFINNIPIYNSDKIDPYSDYILIFAWNYSKMIMSKLVDKYDFKYIIPFPTISIISNISELENKNTL
jgi:SAM-dependent methyltransferase